MKAFASLACRRGGWGLALALSQLLLLAPNPVLAGDDAVRVAGQVVFTTKSSSGGMTADQRAEAIQRNLDNALVAAQDRSPNAVNIVYVKGVPVITLGGYQVVTVSSGDAADAGTTPAILAQQWADALRGSMKDPTSVSSYVAQLTGGPPGGPPAGGPPGGGPGYAAGAGDYGGAPQGQMQGAANVDQYGHMTGPPGGPGGAGGPGYAGGAYGGAPYGGAYGGPPGGYGGPPGAYGGPPGAYGGYPMQRGHVVYAPAGLTMPVSLRTSISTQAAQPGDLIEAALSDSVNTGDSQIPPGTVLVGQIVQAKKGGFLGRSGMLEVKFNSMRTPDGQQVPISAHIVGGIGKYALGKNDEIHGETWKNKVGQVALRGVVGAGAGAALGTAVGAIAGRSGTATGRGAWSGTAIGGGLGVADSLLLRKGKDVTIQSGTRMQVQLDSAVSLAGGQPPYQGQGY